MNDTIMKFGLMYDIMGSILFTSNVSHLSENIPEPTAAHSLFYRILHDAVKACTYLQFKFQTMTMMTSRIITYHNNHILHL